jgi:hypothetical protein
MSRAITRVSPGVYIKEFEPKYGSSLNEILNAKQCTEDIVKYMEEQLRNSFVGTVITKETVERIKSNVYGMAKQYTAAGFPIEIEDLELKNDTLTFRLQIPPFYPNAPFNPVYDFTIENTHSEIKITRKNLTRTEAPWMVTDKP